MALSDADAALLVQLQLAYDKIIAGSKAESVSFSDGRSVKYTTADLDRLQARIDELTAAASTSGRRRGAIRFRIT